MYAGTLKRRCQAPWRSRTATSESGGWAFWSVGDGSESTGPVTSTKARPASQVDHHAGAEAPGQAPRAEGPEGDQRLRDSGRATRW
jgi:hypothetical protein